MNSNESLYLLATVFKRVDESERMGFEQGHDVIERSINRLDKISAAECKITEKRIWSLNFKVYVEIDRISRIDWIVRLNVLCIFMQSFSYF